MKKILLLIDFILESLSTMGISKQRYNGTKRNKRAISMRNAHKNKKTEKEASLRLCEDIVDGVIENAVKTAVDQTTSISEGCAVEKNEEQWEDCYDFTWGSTTEYDR